MDVTCEEQRADNLHATLTLSGVPHICHVYLHGARRPTWTMSVTDGLRNTWAHHFDVASLNQHRTACRIDSWRVYFETIRKAFVAERDVHIALGGSGQCIVKIQRPGASDDLVYQLETLHGDDAVRQVQAVLLRMAEGTSSPLYNKTMDSLHDCRRQLLAAQQQAASSTLDTSFDEDYTATLGTYAADTHEDDDNDEGDHASKRAHTSAPARKGGYRNLLNPSDRRRGKATGVQFDNTSSDSDSD
ncbi:hypothetical protein PTSG_10096 [Salpingoeca rosetta]|uniref:Uncharacterized protein n=1 Tax=Salpingoeca rosetta (strain ATCC 50818 / BSB-021) TaxID=946362 RepID=F2UPH1_SALR5|nr:uncharacterized protein PTSG_10096 [Salpingoeca rosetta]EGD79526.1 hypothetical protein PTSG_10096 [Salpingoeca rosetta]|eukprot:XP_004989007.1 hypothetical protein PTSG_10096 [Salpingoeca rosetta]